MIFLLFILMPSAAAAVVGTSPICYCSTQETLCSGFPIPAGCYALPSNDNGTITNATYNIAPGFPDLQAVCDPKGKTFPLLITGITNTVVYTT